MELVKWKSWYEEWEPSKIASLFSLLQESKMLDLNLMSLYFGRQMLLLDLKKCSRKFVISSKKSIRSWLERSSKILPNSINSIRNHLPLPWNKTWSIEWLECMTCKTSKFLSLLNITFLFQIFQRFVSLIYTFFLVSFLVIYQPFRFRIYIYCKLICRSLPQSSNMSRWCNWRRG